MNDAFGATTWPRRCSMLRQDSTGGTRRGSTALEVSPDGPCHGDTASWQVVGPKASSCRAEVSQKCHHGATGRTWGVQIRETTRRASMSYADKPSRRGLYASATIFAAQVGRFRDVHGLRLAPRGRFERSRCRRSEQVRDLRLPGATRVRTRSAVVATKRLAQVRPASLGFERRGRERRVDLQRTVRASSRGIRPSAAVPVGPAKRTAHPRSGLELNNAGPASPRGRPGPAPRPGRRVGSAAYEGRQLDQRDRLRRAGSQDEVVRVLARRASATRPVRRDHARARSPRLSSALRGRGPRPEVSHASLMALWRLRAM